MKSVPLNYVALHQGREVVYASFSRLFFDAPDERIYSELTVVVPLLKDMAEDTDDSLIKMGFGGLEKFTNKYKSLKGEALENFHMDTLRAFTRLFCLTDSAAVSESIYVSPEHLAMQEPTGIVMDIYLKNGFRMDSKSNEPQDHISYEFMFMSYLAELMSVACEREDLKEIKRLATVSLQFIEEHLLKWLGDFLKTTAAMPQSLELYAPALSFMLGYIKADKTFLEDSLNAV